MDPDPTSVRCETAAFRVNKRKTGTLARKVCEALGVSRHELAVTFVTSAAIRKLNAEFRGKDQPTDVLSFPQAEFRTPLTVKKPFRDSARAGAPPVLGDVVISLPEAAANAKKIGQGLDREVAFLMVHGILHLCGHDHGKAAEEKRMLAQQDALMEMIGGTWTGLAARAPKRASARSRKS